LKTDQRIQEWRQLTGDKTSRYDHQIYHFINHASGEEIFATRYDMRIKIDGSPKLSKLNEVVTGHRNSYKGWSLFGKCTDRAMKRAKNKYG
jgi:hypothetical protein